MASAAAVGVTPRPVRSNSGAPSCASSSATCRLSVGCCAPRLRAAPIRLPASSTARKLRTSAQSKPCCAMHKCIARMQAWAIAGCRRRAHTARHRHFFRPSTCALDPPPCSCSAPTAASARPPWRPSPRPAGACSPRCAVRRRSRCRPAPARWPCPCPTSTRWPRRRRGASVVVHAVNPPYTRWRQEAAARRAPGHGRGRGGWARASCCPATSTTLASTCRRCCGPTRRSCPAMKKAASAASSRPSCARALPAASAAWSSVPATSSAVAAVPGSTW